MFPPYSRKRSASILILLLRIFIGVMFFTHGLDKMINFNELSYSYPSVFGFGSYMTLMLSIFIEQTENIPSVFLYFSMIPRQFMRPKPPPLLLACRPGLSLPMVAAS